MSLQSTTLTLLLLALSSVSAAPFDLERRKGGGGGGGGRGGGGGIRGGGGGGRSGSGLATWKIVVIVFSILIGIVALWWSLPKYVLPRSKRWQARMERKEKEREEQAKLVAFMAEKLRKEQASGGMKIVAGASGVLGSL